MEKYNSRLHYLMKAMDITGRELAAAIHVDPSLVSKWRNNHRALSRHSAHVAKIVDYFVSLDYPQSLREIAVAYDPELEPANEMELAAVLGRWLVDPRPLGSSRVAIPLHADLHEEGYDALYTVYKGDAGRREAVLEFLDQVLDMPPGQTLYLLSQEDLAWLVGDSSFLADWRVKLAEVLKQHKIVIIHWVDRSIDSLNTIISRWLPLHLTGGIESWFLPRYSDSPFQLTLFIVENKMVIVGMASDNPTTNRYTALFTDPTTTKQCQLIYSSYLAKCRPLIEVYPTEQIQELVHRACHQDGPRRQAYLAWEPLMATQMSRGLLAQVLRESEVPSGSTERCLEYYDEVLAASCHSRGATESCLINVDNLKEYLHREQTYSPELSALTGHRILISRAHLMQHLREIVQRLQSDNEFEVVFFTRAEAAHHPPVNLWLQDGGMVIAWSRGFSYAASVSEPTVVQAFFQYYDGIWHTVPRIRRGRRWIIEEILGMIA